MKTSYTIALTAGALAIGLGTGILVSPLSTLISPDDASSNLLVPQVAPQSSVTEAGLKTVLMMVGVDTSNDDGQPGSCVATTADDEANLEELRSVTTTAELEEWLSSVRTPETPAPQATQLVC